MADLEKLRQAVAVAKAARDEKLREFVAKSKSLEDTAVALTALDNAYGAAVAAAARAMDPLIEMDAELQSLLYRARMRAGSMGNR